MEKLVYIYALEYPEGNIRYIGKTVNLRRRYKRHIREARKCTSSHKLAWIRSILNENDLPYVSILDKVPLVEWEYWERYYIQKAKEDGYDLVNSTNGGDGNSNPSKAVRDKISKSLKKYYENAETWNKGLRGISSGYPKGKKRTEKDRLANSNRKKEYFKTHEPWNKDILKPPVSDYKGRENLNTKHIYQCDLDGKILREWVSVSVAYHTLGFGRKGITRCLKGIRKSAYGFIWKYV